MTKLVTTPNIDDPDGFYAELLALHEGRSKRASDGINAELVLILANHIGDHEALREAFALAGPASGKQAANVIAPAKLYTYWRSTAAYRVRIALNLKGVEVEQVPVHLARDGGEQHRPAYRAIHPAGTVPALVLDDGTVITQSLAIIALLDDLYPEPALLPPTPVERARVRAAAELIACDIHPINNLRVGQYIKGTLEHDQAAVVTWMRHWMRDGLEAFERLIAADTRMCFSDQPTLADLCLIPQLYNARRWDLDLAGLERLVAIEQRCLAVPAFLAARPEAQADAEL